jgi:hypothetical protein
VTPKYFVYVTLKHILMISLFVFLLIFLPSLKFRINYQCTDQEVLKIAKENLISGFEIQIYTNKIRKPKQLAMNSKGVVFVSTEENSIFAIPEKDKTFEIKKLLFIKLLCIFLLKNLFTKLKIWI